MLNLRVFFNIFKDFRKFENWLNGAESREELQHATKIEKQRIKGIQPERKFLPLNLLSNFSVLELLFGHFEKLKTRERNRSFVKKSGLFWVDKKASGRKKVRTRTGNDRVPVRASRLLQEAGGVAPGLEPNGHTVALQTLLLKCFTL